MTIPSPQIDVKNVLGRVVSYLDIAVHSKDHRAFVEDVNTVEAQYGKLQHELEIVANERDSLKRKAERTDEEREESDRQHRQIALLMEANNELRYLNKYAAENASKASDILIAERSILSKCRAELSALNHEYTKLDREHKALKFKQQSEVSEIRLAAALEQVKVAEQVAKQAQTATKAAENKVRNLTAAFPAEVAKAKKGLEDQIAAQARTACEREVERVLNELRACFEQESRARAEELTRNFLEERGCSVSLDGTFSFPMVASSTSAATSTVCTSAPMREIHYVERIHVETADKPCEHCIHYLEMIAKLKHKLSKEKVINRQAERDRAIVAYAQHKATTPHHNKKYGSLRNQSQGSGGKQWKSNQGGW